MSETLTRVCLAPRIYSADWCIGPTDPNQLNTFIERPAIQGRLVFWLSALHAVDGMLYYSVNRWSERNCSAAADATCRPLRRINNTALTDFNPATFRTANGDGSFTYPGEAGPLATIRLVNIADGIEDWQLFSRLGTSGGSSISHADDLITQLISNITAVGRVEDPALLERVRRQAAHRIMAG